MEPQHRRLGCSEISSRYMEYSAFLDLWQEPIWCLILFLGACVSVFGVMDTDGQCSKSLSPPARMGIKKVGELFNASLSWYTKLLGTSTMCIHL